MSWQVFIKSPRPTRRINGCVMSIQKQGLAILSFEAYTAMGSPERVQLLWDAESRQVGIRPASGDGTYKVHPLARSFLIGSMLAHYDLNHLRSQRMTLRPIGDLWAFEAGDPR